MKVIARGVGYGSIFVSLIAISVYGFITIGILPLIINGSISFEMFLFFLLALVSIIVFMGILITGIKSTRKIISYDKKRDELYLHPENRIIHIGDIVKITHKNDTDVRSLTGERMSGTLVIITNTDEYKYDNVGFANYVVDKLENLVCFYNHK